MDLAQAVFREGLAQLGEAVLQVFQVQRLALLDEREDEIYLAPLLYLTVDAFIERCHAVVIDVEGAHGLAAGGQFVDDADVKVAIERHGQRTRNGGGRHHQHVGWVLALAPELGTLGNAEAVLLIDHHHTETGKLHRVFNDGMGTDEYLHLACQQTVENLLAFLSLHHTSQQFHADGHVAQEVADGLQVLFGQDFRGRHDAGLIAVVQGDEHGHECHEGLARPYVTLQQTVHLPTAAHVLAYLLDDALLGTRQFEGQVAVVERVKQVADPAEHIPSVLAALVARVP